MKFEVLIKHNLKCLGEKFFYEAKNVTQLRKQLKEEWFPKQIIYVAIVEKVLIKKGI